MHFICLFLVWVSFSLTALAQAGSIPPRPRQLDPISGGDVLRRKAESEILFPGSDIVRALLVAANVDSLGGGNILRALNGVTNGAVVRSLEKLSNEEFLDLLDEFRGGEALAVLDRITGGEILRSLDNIEGTEVLLALDKARRKTRDAEKQQHTLDTLTGMAFGEMKRMDSLSGTTFGMSKRNFDEIDNVGFNNWSKRFPSYRKQALALAKRKPFRQSSLAKRNFDEIDRIGFEGFSKRDIKSTA